MLHNNISWCEEHVGTKKGKARLNASNVMLLWWIMLYFVDKWPVNKETSWKQGNLFKTAAQRKTQNQSVSAALSNDICQCCKWKGGYSHMACMFSVGFFPHFSKIFHDTFPPLLTSHPRPLDVTVMCLLWQNTVLHKMAGWWPVLGGGNQ